LSSAIGGESSSSSGGLEKKDGSKAGVVVVVCIIDGGNRGPVGNGRAVPQRLRTMKIMVATRMAG
jgi:hypothetical protein